MKRQDDMEQLATSIVARKEEAARKSSRRVVTILVAVQLAIAAALGYLGWQYQQEAAAEAVIARRSACNVLAHEVFAGDSFRTVIGTLKALGVAAADDPDDGGFRRQAEAIEVPAPPDQQLIDDYNTNCRDLPGFGPLRRST